MTDSEIKEMNLIKALKLNLITWDFFFQEIAAMDETKERVYLK